MDQIRRRLFCFADGSQKLVGPNYGRSGAAATATHPHRWLPLLEKKKSDGRAQNDICGVRPRMLLLNRVEEQQKGEAAPNDGLSHQPESTAASAAGGG